MDCPECPRKRSETSSSEGKTNTVLDFDPKNPGESFDTIEYDAMVAVLKSYMNRNYYELNNFEVIISRAETVTVNGVETVKFNLSMFNLYLKYDDLTYFDAEPIQPSHVLI